MWPGEFSCKSPDKLLVRVMGDRQIEGRLSELDGQNVQVGCENTGKICNKVSFPGNLVDAAHIEAPCDDIEADSHDNDGRVISHHLDKFALGAQVAVRGIHREAGKHEKKAGKHQSKDDKEKIGPRKKERAGEYHEEKKEEHEEILKPVDRNPFFA